MSQAKKSVKSKSSILKQLTLGALIAVLGIGGGYKTSLQLNQVTEDKYMACTEDQFVQWVGRAEMFIGFGGRPEQALESATKAFREGKIDRETYDVSTKAIEFVASGNYKESPTVAAFAQCLNK